MKWEMSIGLNEQEIYSLCHGEKKLLTLEFHPFTNSARIQYAGEKRVFLVRKEGFLRNRTVLRNEYGILLGQLVKEKHPGADGVIELNNEKFFYVIRKTPSVELVLYKDSPDKPFVVCGLNENEVNTNLSVNKSATGSSEHFLLMALCWYMFLPVAKENMMELAE